MTRGTARQDLQHALRGIRRSPGLSVVVTLALALGIGATTALFGVVDAVFLRPLPYASPSALVRVFDVQRDVRELPASYPEFLDWRQRTSDIFSDFGACLGQGEVLSGDGDAEQLQGAMVSPNVPAMLGLKPILGRTFRADEEGSGQTHVVVLSEGLWRTHFGANRAIVGRTITLTGEPFTVIGVFAAGPATVLPSQWYFAHGRGAAFWRPLNLTAESSPRGLHHLDVVARLRPGVTQRAASARLATVAAELVRSGVTKHGIEVASLATTLVGDLRTPVSILLGAVGILLLIACANVANLLLARATSRRREFAVRAALGAGRSRLISLGLLEGMVRGVIGGAAGVLLAYVLAALARRSLGASIPRMSELTIDAPVLGVAILISIAVGVLVGTLPALRSARSDLVNDLRDGARTIGAGVPGERFRRRLMVAEIAMSFVLVTTGALLARSFHNVLSVPLGFDPSNLVSARTWLPAARYRDSLSQITFNSRLTDALASEFGRGNVTLTSALPIEGGTSGSVNVVGRTSAGSDMPLVEERVVGNEYFDVMRARFVAGRAFGRGDVLGAPPVAVVNEAFVKRWFPNEGAVGRQLVFGWGTDAQQTIVGVVADVREGPLDHGGRPSVYVSALQVPNSFMNAVIRTSRAPDDVGRIYRSALRRLDPALPTMDVRSLSDVIESSVRQRRLVTVVLASFAASALLLAAIGLYGVVSYSVAQRTQEFGIRSAIGARAIDLIRLVLAQTAWLVGTGIVVGIVLSLGARRLIEAQLFGVSSGDSAELVFAVVLLTVVALVASAVPTIRAARADPLEALRTE
jgi:putative ABC transport system permease protein